MKCKAVSLSLYTYIFAVSFLQDSEVTLPLNPMHIIFCLDSFALSNVYIYMHLQKFLPLDFVVLSRCLCRLVDFRELGTALIPS